MDTDIYEYYDKFMVAYIRRYENEFWYGSICQLKIAWHSITRQFWLRN